MSSSVYLHGILIDRDIRHMHSGRAMAHAVCVTGGTGFVATELISQLLQKGYNVRATVRNKHASEKVDPLLKLGNAFPGNLELIEGDLLQPGSFDDAFKGCKYIFHTASPFFIEATDPQKELVDVAVLGTRNVMQSAAKAAPSGLSRIVLTSSCAAVKGFKTPAQPSNGSTYSERDWNEVSTVANGEAYWASKTLAERAAWDLAKEMDLDLVTILPEFIMGPVISSRTDGTSVGYMKQWVEGKVLSGAPVFADVRDVARAHILAAETPSAQGRYIVAAAESTPPQVISAWLKERFPDGSFEDVADDQHEESKVVIDNGRVQKELGLVLTPVKSTIIDMAVTLVQLGIAKET